MSSFRGKTIVVTGAGSGIGRATCEYLDSLGANLILVGRTEQRLRETSEILQQNAEIVVADLADIESIEPILKPVVSKGGVSGLVHCAGVSVDKPLNMFKYQALHNVMLINFYAFYELVRVLTKKGMYDPNGMSIVAISSTASKSGKKAHTAYCASKAAVDGAVRAMAAELASKKIRVNSVLPCFVETGMTKEFIEMSIANGRGEEIVSKRQLLGMCPPEKVATVVGFLLSDDSAWITGADIPCDGGFLYSSV